MTPYLGQVTQFGFDWAPADWALCHGQTLSIGQNQALYSLLGTHFGGNGRTDFGVPDLRGRAPVHEGPALFGSIVNGTKYGFETIVLTKNNLPAHTHSMPAEGSAATQPFAGGTNYLADTSSNGVLSYSVASNLVAMSPSTLPTSKGGSQGHNNVQPSLVINFSIALDGVYPPRN